MFAAIEDLEIKLRRPLTDAETEDAEILLEDALNLMRRRIPDLEEQATADDVFAGIVTLVQKNAVCRVLRNPEGLKEESDEGYGTKVDPRVSSGVMDIMPSEWKNLGLDASTGSGYMSLDAWRFLPAGTA